MCTLPGLLNGPATTHRTQACCCIMTDIRIVGISWGIRLSSVTLRSYDKIIQQKKSQILRRMSYAYYMFFM
jgi:hypothetical protein